MNLKEAAERALDALEDIFGKEKKDVGAINALRQALAQPEREWVGLTDQEIWDLGADHAIDLAWAREIEAKLKEKNV